MMQVIYLEITEKPEIYLKAYLWISVSRILKYLSVSRSDYCVWLDHVLSTAEKVNAQIKAIYEKSKQNSDAPKRIKNQHVKDKSIPNLSQKKIYILNEDFNPKHSNVVWCSDVTYISMVNGFVYLTNNVNYSNPVIFLYIFTFLLFSRKV